MPPMHISKFKATTHSLGSPVVSYSPSCGGIGDACQSLILEVPCSNSTHNELFLTFFSTQLLCFFFHFFELLAILCAVCVPRLPDFLPITLTNAFALLANHCTKHSHSFPTSTHNPLYLKFSTPKIKTSRAG